MAYHPKDKFAMTDRGARENGNPTIIGIYGIPGSGKSFLLKQLERELGCQDFEFYEGSEVISSLIPGGLDTFKKMPELQKEHWRRLAIDKIGKTCGSSGRVGIVAGHFMFWTEGEEKGRPVYTDNDLGTFSHIIYLDTPADLTFQQRANDKGRSRPLCSLEHLQDWQTEEKKQLRSLCYQHGILFSIVTPNSTMLNRILTLLRDFVQHSEEFNLSGAERQLDELVIASPAKLHTMLVLDADRTMSSEDSGRLFWDLLSNDPQTTDKEYHLKTLFSSPLGYSYTAFRQATLLYEDFADDSKFAKLCDETAVAIAMYPEFVALLRQIAEHDQIGAVVITCGLRRVWETILDREGLSGKIKVIGGGRTIDGIVVTAAVKAAMVSRLKYYHNVHVLAFGDSVLDLPMLCQADEAIVVVGDTKTRSKIMDGALLDAIENGGLSARQVLLPSNVSARLNTTILPALQLTNPSFINSIIQQRSRGLPRIFHATKRNAAKQLMTPMRDARVSGPALREAHRRAGWYLATEFLTNFIGVEEYSIPHVQGNETTGYRLRNEKSTLIVALMRGGEPMALGVNDAFPSAMFLHAKNPEDVKLVHVSQKKTIILVDSVINSGKTVVDFVRHIRDINSSIRITVVAGVVQAQAISEGSLAQEIDSRPNLGIVALRLSQNKFTGRGTTDTGNRLFNSTHIP
ncbi:hypothetical protein TWF106_002603 [Orbilia oligospora]|uniref:Phosphoribosyltransferase domain-containing protein n=2 Tax=Orbilia oligospora TaxID=2813651 RepID=A0A7C8QV54_ORBOL|nr:hypothetical protein TWF788_004734 [Orbilia oligospora]KAF3225467.1 hypothetical protein TWF106_002603 [Orbilia oligospora]